MVCQDASSALLLSFPFVYLFLINTGVCIGPDPMHYFLPRYRWFPCRFFLVFLCLVYPFFLAVYFGFFTTAAVGSFRFRFPLEADPEESPYRSFSSFNEVFFGL